MIFRLFSKVFSWSKLCLFNILNMPKNRGSLLLICVEIALFLGKNYMLKSRVLLSAKHWPRGARALGPAHAWLVHKEELSDLRMGRKVW